MQGNSPDKLRARGFTVLELMIVVVIVAVVLALAVPTLASSLALQRQRAVVQSLFSSFNLARREAIIRAAAVTVCPLGEEPDSCGDDYAVGWQVFTDGDRDQRRDASTETLLRQYPPPPGGLRVTNRAGTRPAGEAVTWFPDGTARRTLTLQLCDPVTAASAAFSLVLNSSGRARIARGEGQCPGLWL